MRRFTDPILLFALFVIDVLAWAVLSLTSSITVTDPGHIAPMGFGTIVVVAAPALLIAALLALWRSLSNLRPRAFYTAAMCAAIVGCVVTAVAGMIARAQELEVGFTFMAWLFGVMAFGFLLALVIALTGAIPVPEKVMGEVVKPADMPAHVEPPMPEPEPEPAPLPEPDAAPELDGLTETDAPASPINPEDDPTR